ncbi:MAG: hypothetical protein QHH80_01495 [Anaerolineae bacterium]|jgi:hypothetical protein|nr:hypothetical protein [Anaerolineae bacterium]
MSEKDDLKKLAVLLPHWAEHNAEHAEEFRQWAQRAEAAGQTVAAQRIREAAAALEQANQALAAAMRDIPSAA